MKIIKLKNVSYSVDKKKEIKIINDISLDINEGEFIGVIGNTGSGKTTLLKLISGLIIPTEGKIEVSGEFGFVFQFPERQLFEETVKKEISIGLKDDKDRDRKIDDVLDLVDLDKKILSKSPFEISGGEQRKVALADILIMEPDILLLDEPTVGLDPKNKKDILNEIKKYQNKNKKRTIIMVSHDANIIFEYASKILLLEEGRIVKFSNKKDILDNFSDIKDFIPEITNLFVELKNLNMNINENIFSLNEAMFELKKHKGVK